MGKTRGLSFRQCVKGGIGASLAFALTGCAAQRTILASPASWIGGAPDTLVSAQSSPASAQALPPTSVDAASGAPRSRLKIHTSMRFEGAHGGERKIATSDVFEEGRWQMITGADSGSGRVMILGRLREVIGDLVKMEYLILDGSHPGVIVSDPTVLARRNVPNGAGAAGPATLGVENKKTGRITVAVSVE